MRSVNLADAYKRGRLAGRSGEKWPGSVPRGDERAIVEPLTIEPQPVDEEVVESSPGEIGSPTRGVESEGIENGDGLVLVVHEEGELIAVVLGVGVMSLGLCLFRRGPSRFQPPEPIAGALHFIGWHTLEIYAIQLAGSELIIKLAPNLAA